VDFSQLKIGQLCNHFPNNQELTTKTGLVRNLSRLCDYGIDYEAWFPRCYDFTEERQIQEFLNDFQRTSVVNFVKKHVKYFKSIHKEQLKNLKKRYRKDPKGTIQRAKETFWLKPNNEKTLINIKMLKAGITFVQYQTRLRNEILNDNRAEKWIQLTKNNKNLFETLSTLGQCNSLDSLKKIAPNDWRTPSAYLEFKTILSIKEYNKVYPQSNITGTENIWVVKPSFSSRGIGVHCINSPKEIATAITKMKAKVVQKYIERTFLLNLPGPKGKLEKRKFDLRQWVLVTSINPLVIYMFNSCYLRICGSEFVLEDFKDKYKHISNFSIQKSNERVNNIKDKLIMSVPQFVDHVKEHFGIRLDWQNEMIPKLSKIIKETIYSGYDSIEHKPNSFELYGFDFVLDYKLNPWLIEVNLSPACAERKDWLVKMLGN